MANRIYIGMNAGKIGWMDPDTLAYTALPDVDAGGGPLGAVSCIHVPNADDNDIWVGLNTGASGPVRVAHYDGASWSYWDIASPGYYGTVVCDILVYATDDVYVAWGAGGAPNGYLHHWNGSTWTQIGYTRSYGLSAFIGAKTGGQPAVEGLVELASDSNLGGMLVTWDGVTWTQQNGPINYPKGLARKLDGEAIAFADYGLIYTKSGSIIGTWTLRADWSGGFGNDLRCAWVDPVTDDAWAFGDDDYNTYLHHYKDGTYTRLEHFGYSVGNLRSVCTGIHYPAGSVLYASGDAYVRRRAVGGTWTTSAVLPQNVVSLHAFAPETVPPVIDTNTPTGTIDDTRTNITFKTKDVGGSGVKQDTIACQVGGEDAIIAGVFQTGWDGGGSSITPNAFDGFDVVIDPTSQLHNIVEVSAYCEDNNGNPQTLEWSFEINDFIKSVTYIDANTLHVEFREDLLFNEGTLQPSTYGVIAVSGGVSVLVSGVAANESEPSWVNLTVTKLTGESPENSYRLEVLSGVLQDSFGAYITEPEDLVKAFSAALFRPFAKTASASSANQVDIEFSEPMEQNDDIINPSKYSIDGGLAVLAVSVISQTIVRLYVNPAMATDQLYTVTVTP